jgi:hypothetical protein
MTEEQAAALAVIAINHCFYNEKVIVIGGEGGNELV